MHSFFMETPVGSITVTSDGKSISQLCFAKLTEETETAFFVECECKKQLEEYFAGRLRQFNIPTAASGTEFQRKVWSQLQNIPYGKTESYASIAFKAGVPKGYRAVGQAVHNNPIAIIIPCHRVICSDGSLGGFAGGTDKKIKLLELEGARTVNAE